MPSKTDEIFEKIFSRTPNKDGVAFEQLAAIICHLINGGEVKHDNKLRGEFSKTLYQLDVHQIAESASLMGEAKDYSVRDSKVGRGDIQKLGGALPDLKEINSGMFFSATGYTKPAQKYAEEAQDIIGKPITLYGLRPSTELDERGFIKTIIIKVYITTPQPQNAKWSPRITEKGQDALKKLLKEGQELLEVQSALHFFYDDKGREVLSLQELTSYGYGDINQDTGKTHACFCLTGKYIKIKGVLAEIHGLEYEVPYTHETEEIRITDDSENRLALLDKDGNAIKIITDKKLRKYEFDESGNLKKR